MKCTLTMSAFAALALAVFAMSTLPAEAAAPAPVPWTPSVLGAGVIGVGSCAASGCFTPEPSRRAKPASGAPASGTASGYGSVTGSGAHASVTRVEHMLPQSGEEQVLPRRPTRRYRKLYGLAGRARPFVAGSLVAPFL